jgi:hypothetical protein
MKNTIQKPSIVINSNNDTIYGPIAESVSDKIGELCFTTTTNGIQYHAAFFPEFGIIPNIPDEFVTITTV